MSQKTSLNQPTLIKRGSEGFTLVELLVVIAIIGTLAALFSGNILSALRKGDEVSCTNNLRNMGQSAIAYALDKRFFPVAKGKNPPAYESLNVLVNSGEGSDLSPDVFICPSSLEIAAEKDEAELLRTEGYANTVIKRLWEERAFCEKGPAFALARWMSWLH